MPVQVNQARLLQTGLYPAEVVAKYARARKYQKRLTIQTFVQMYEAADGGIHSSADYCPRIADTGEKLEVHKRIMQNIAVDTLAAVLNAKTRSQCAEFMHNPDSIHVLISTRIKDHPLCPNTMDFYSQVLGKSNPVQFHGQLVNGIVAAIQDGWDQFAGAQAEWNFLSADKFKRFFSKRVQQFTNLEEPVETIRMSREPELEPISEPSTRTMPGTTPISDDLDDDWRYYEESDDGVNEEAVSEDIGSEEETSSDGVLEVKSVLADNKPATVGRTLRPYVPVESHGSDPVMRHVAKDKRYRPDLIPISELEAAPQPEAEIKTEKRRSKLIPLNDEAPAPVRSKLIPLEQEIVDPVRPKVTPIAEAPRVRPKLLPLESESRAAAAPVATRERQETPKDRLGGEILPPTTVRRSNLTAIGSEVSQSRKSTLKPYNPEAPKSVRSKLVPIQEEEQSAAASPAVRARPKTVPIDMPVKSKRPMPSYLISTEEEDTGFGNVQQSLRWLESYLDTNGHRFGDELVFFAPTNTVSQRIVEMAESRGKQPAVKPIVECHLCEHSGNVDMATLKTVGGHEIKMGRRGKITQPKVRSEWADFVGTKDVSGFKVHVYAQGNVFKH